MPVVATSAYGLVENVLLDARAITLDMAIPGGDVLTDDAPFSMQFVNQAYRRIQSYLAQYGVETYSTFLWLLNIPANTTGDPESRVLLSDSGTEVITPSGAGESSFAEPILPDDLVCPLRLRERPNGSTGVAIPMHRPNDGLRPYRQPFQFLRHWDWRDDNLWFYGATQNIDIELMYEKHLPILQQVTDTVPIRGVDNAAAYRVAYAFSKGRGGEMADSFGQEGQIELDLLANRAQRAKQRIKHRKQPFSKRRRSGYGGM
jgi:hypothetical protein